MHIQASLFVSTALLAGISAFAAEDVNEPVRPIGVNGQEAWNGRSTSFLYAPTFGFKAIAGAAKYRFSVNGKIFEALARVTGKAAYREGADRAFAFIERGPLKTWNWEGQFEDTPQAPKYQNLTKHDACSTAIYLLSRFPGDKGRLAQARELLRFKVDSGRYDLLEFMQIRF